MRRLFTLQLRTRNPFHLILMFVFGVIPFSLSVAITWAVFSESLSWLILIFPSLVTVPLTINFVLSILEIAGIISSAGSKASLHEKVTAKKKDLPKRRKDFR